MASAIGLLTVQYVQYKDRNIANHSYNKNFVLCATDQCSGFFLSTRYLLIYMTINKLTYLVLNLIFMVVATNSKLSYWDKNVIKKNNGSN